MNRKDDLVEVVFGVPVADPYRWLEDGDAPEVRAWVAAQNARTRAALDALPWRTALRDRLLALLGVPVCTSPVVAADRVFSLDRGPGAEQAVLAVRDATTPGPGRTVVDPAARTGDPTAAVDWFHPSRDGRLVAWGLSVAGTERSTLYVTDVDDPDASPTDTIADTRAASVAWLPDATGFAYTRYPPGADYGRVVRFHELGSDPAADPVLFVPEETTDWPDVDISPDGRFWVVHVSRGWTRTDVFLIERATGERRSVVAGVDAVTAVRVVGDRLVGVTNLDAPRGRVITAPLDSPDCWETLVGEGDDVIEAAMVAGPSLLVVSNRHAAVRLRRVRPDDGDTEEVELGELGSLAGIDADPGSERAFLSFTSFTRPPELRRWEPSGLVRWSDAELPFEPGDYVVEQVFYPSTDATPIPMFLVRHRRTRPSPSTPTVLTAYGGFAVSQSPAYSAGIPLWCDAGGLYAVACVRGGNEYGEDWHRAGMLANKQQVFDDFAAAASWLVEAGWTSPGRLAIRGGSNGGLLVAATITQRPDLCRAAVCAVPLTDMLRYHRSGLGALWVPEYGDPGDPEAFRWLLAYSPYHHVDDGVAYPATLVLTAEEDSRVDPMHARKFAARLQDATAVGEHAPVLLRVEEQAGHGAGKPLHKQAEEAADVWAFLFWQLGVTPPVAASPT